MALGMLNLLCYSCNNMGNSCPQNPIWTPITVFYCKYEHVLQSIKCKINAKYILCIPQTFKIVNLNIGTCGLSISVKCHVSYNSLGCFVLN